jgi:hypothetical protein
VIEAIACFVRAAARCVAHVHGRAAETDAAGAEARREEVAALLTRDPLRPADR